MSKLFSFVCLLCVLHLPLYAVEFSSGTKATNTIEIYSSEGCSSCPPAEKWVSNFLKDKTLFTDVIPMVFHVDYWDHIGWEDTFATPRHSLRQRLYKSEGLSGSVYTPQFMVNSYEWKGWFALFGRDNWHRTQQEVGVLSVRTDGTHLHASFTPTQASDENLQLHIAILGMGIESHIKKGENEGELLLHDFVVLSHETLALTANTKPTTSWKSFMPKIPSYKQKKSALVVWVSTGDSQRIIQSAAAYLE